MENMGINPSFWPDRKVLVTGASGLLGSWLIKWLINVKADVVCLIRDWIPQSEFVRRGFVENTRVVRGDICDQILLERILGEYEIKTVFHLAAQTIVSVANRNPISTFSSNIQGTWNLLEACRRSPVVEQIVIASSDKAYGDQTVLPYNEFTPLQGKHPYDVSKSCSDLIGQTYANTYNLPVAITRCGNFYGGGDLNWNRIVPGTIRSILRGQEPIIRSDGKFIRDYLYVEDGVAAYMKVAEKLAENPKLSGEAFNFSTESKISVLELVEQILTQLNSNLKPVIKNESKHEIRDQYLDATKAHKILDWSPLYNLQSGLQKTINWYEEYFDPIKYDKVAPTRDFEFDEQLLYNSISN
jgi:CDP-glucose 4,6-dehydratase